MMDLKKPNNFTKLSESAFVFANRSKKWTFNDPAFEGVLIQEYWTKDLVRNGEDTVTFFKGSRELFDDINHFIAAVTILSFEDSYFIHEHEDELIKRKVEALDIESFFEMWRTYSSLVREHSIEAPVEVVKAYSTDNDWNYVTIFSENLKSYHGMIWETTA